jgi:2-aminomuconate deaminase
MAALSLYRSQKRWALMAAAVGLAAAMAAMASVLLKIPGISPYAPMIAAPGLLVGIIAAFAWGAISFHEVMENERRQSRPARAISVASGAAPAPVGAYPHARRAGDFLYLSGVGPRLPNSNQIPGNRYDEAGALIDYDIEAQCRSVFANVRAILEASGARWEDLIDVTVYLTDMARDFQTYNRLYAEHFTSAQPCRTTLGIVALPTPIAIELKCVAYLGDSR